jgi:hypothetical protein
MRQRKRRDFLLIEKKAKLVPGRRYRYTEWDGMSNWVECIYSQSILEYHLLKYANGHSGTFSTEYIWKLTPLEI